MEPNIVTKLVKKGVNIPNPESVYVSSTIDPDRISSDNVTIHAGCKLFGEKTLILKNSVIGYETPVTIENSMLGENTHLKGGFFKGAVFAGDNTFGSGAHVREGTILEEQANAAHNVGLKQTILFPFVTLGSLINFCDCFMAGGTSRKDHSEVGSSFIHFNYTPNQDKATPSMMGDVHQGVMLHLKAIFLGGQGGLVGPVRIGYGCISAAGSIIRKNELRKNRLLLGGSFKEASFPRKSNVYTNVLHIYNNNIYYIANLIALAIWYRHVRFLFVKKNSLSAQLYEGMVENLNVCIDERIKRLKDFSVKLDYSRQELISQGRDKDSKPIVLHDKTILSIKSAENVFDLQLKKNNITPEGERFIKFIKNKAGDHGVNNYIEVIQRLSNDERESGSQWLKGIEQEIIDQLMIEQD